MKTQKFIFGMFILVCLFSSCLKEPDPSIGPFKDSNREATVETAGFSEILSTSAKVVGNITDIGLGVSDYGHCWCANMNPTTSDCKTSHGVRGKTGTYESELSDLQPGQIYHVRAYVKWGDRVVFGNDIAFNTQELRK